jgi:NADPH:quinone reductase-like Zn-dependent oxidoreductase
MMKAIVCPRYGPPEVLRLEEVEKPVPKEGEVLIRIHNFPATTASFAGLTGTPLPARLITGIAGPRKKIQGMQLAGEVEAAGKNVTRFRIGDPVFGSTGLQLGAYAEYACLKETAALAPKPSNMSYAEAAAVVEGGVTALPFLRETTILRRGQKILINGASGAVGTAAVQLAKYFGAEVTAVCGAANAGLVKSLGADRVVDYSREDFTARGETYDVIFDAVAKSSFPRCRRSLADGGVYLTTVPIPKELMYMAWTSLTGGKRAKFAAMGLRPDRKKREDLLFLKGLIEAGKLKAVIDKTYPLERTGEALRYVLSGHKRGNVVIEVCLSNSIR